MFLPHTDVAKFPSVMEAIKKDNLSIESS